MSDRYKVVRRTTTTACLLWLSACGPGKNTPSQEFVPHMMVTPAVKAQRLGPFREPMRTPVEGTIPQNYQPYHYANDPEGAGRNLKNPLSRDRVTLERGQKLYNTFCIVCHGSRGEGDGTVVPKFPRPPSLLSEKVRNWPDGRIYHVITIGQNLMPSYASQLDPTERWAVIHYVRVLQRAGNPLPSDLKK